VGDLVLATLVSLSSASFARSGHCVSNPGPARDFAFAAACAPVLGAASRLPSERAHVSALAREDAALHGAYAIDARDRDRVERSCVQRRGRVLLRPLPYPGAERIVYLYGSELDKDNLVQIQGSLRSFAAIAVHGLVDVDVETGNGVTRAVAMPVTEQFFPILGSTPAHGRLFAASDHLPAAAPVVVITDGLAVRRFGSGESAVGQTFSIDGRAFTVIGVLPPGFTYRRHASAEMWFPAVHFEDPVRSVMARLGDGVTMDEARTEAIRIARLVDAEARTAEHDAYARSELTTGRLLDRSCSRRPSWRPWPR
jgi:hypothetical protein